MAPITLTTVSNEDEIQQILALQSQNLAANISPETLESQGFVTVRHTPEVLQAMNRARPSVIAKDGDRVVGYCLVMPRSFGSEIPELVSMFRMLDKLEWRGQPLKTQKWFVMGQVCVADGYRGQGIFDELYRHLREVCSADFDFVVTEISARNLRSKAAHRRVGFETVHVFTDNSTGETWEVVVWDWS